jgi:membrane protein YdbS with pleckstrin-like domain
MSEHRLRDLIEANLQRLIAALLVFIAAAVVALFVDVALPFMVVAAALALVALVAIVVWIADPWSRWREDARRRLLFVGFHCSVQRLSSPSGSSPSNLLSFWTTRRT